MKAACKVQPTFWPPYRSGCSRWERTSCEESCLSATVKRLHTFMFLFTRGKAVPFCASDKSGAASSQLNSAPRSAEYVLAVIVILLIILPIFCFLSAESSCYCKDPLLETSPSPVARLMMLQKRQYILPPNCSALHFSVMTLAEMLFQ